MPTLLVQSLSICLAAAVVACSGGRAAGQDLSTRVSGAVSAPADLASFDDSTVEIKLWEYDPLLADASAKLIDETRIDKFSHAHGKETRHDFVVGDKPGGEIKPRLGYYITLFIVKDGRQTHIGRCHHADFLCKVLADGQPRNVSITVREAGK